MAHEALRVRSAPTGVVLAMPGVGARNRQIAVASGVAELAFGLGVLGCATSAADGALRGLVVAITVAFLVVRVVLGWARAGLVGGIAFGLLTATGLVTVAATLGEAADLRLGAALVALGMVPLAAGSVPAMTLPLERGERRDITPSLLTSALCCGLGVLVAILIAGAVDVDDDRLSTLVPYIAVAFAMLAMAEVLGHHRIGSGFPGTVVVIGAGALALHVVLLADQRTTAVEAAVSAATIASAAAALGLLASTALASPRPCSTRH